MVREFLGAWKVDPRSITAACFGVAGAVTDQVARLTNVPWLVDGEAVGTALGLKRAEVINDLEALAYAVPVLEADELAVLQQGVAVPGGNAAVIAAGTGLGVAMLHNVDGRFVPVASEGGHADFAARTPRELELVAELTRVFGRVGVEHVISGPGLVNIYQFTHQSFGTGPTITPNTLAPATLCAGVGAVETMRSCRGASTSRRARGAARSAWRRSTCSSRPTARKRATSRCARRDGRRLRRRRHRAEDPAGARVGAVPRSVPRQGADGRSRRDDSGLGDPQSRCRPPGRGGAGDGAVAFPLATPLSAISFSMSATSTGAKAERFS